MRRIMATIVFSLSLFLLSQSFPAVAKATKTEDRGQKLFAQYCASCHGLDGKGGGPAAASLKTPLPDLTMIEKREGKFNQIKVQQIISGEMGYIAHGSKEMPVWGYIFRQKPGGQPAATVNIYALSAYIKSIQK